MKKRIRLLLSYDGTDFCGWQKQLPHVETIQGTIENALSRVFETPINIFGSGRTDSGVHAKGQVAHFDSPKELGSINIVKAINSLVPKSIVVHQAFEAPNEFHAIRSAIKKTYKYYILNTKTPCPIRRRFAAWCRKPLSFDILRSYEEKFIGKKDFKSFQSIGSNVTTSVREIYSAHWEQNEDMLIFTVTANGFLKQMVRNIVGTMIDLSRHHIPPHEIDKIFELRDRRAAKIAARPEGLILESVIYPSDLDKKCRQI